VLAPLAKPNHSPLNPHPTPPTQPPNPNPNPTNPNPQAELRSVSSLLATRCAAYKVLYEQLVRNVGSEGSGSRGADAPVLIFNTNSNTVDASPVTHNTNQADAQSRAKAINQGLGAAALAAAALALGIIVKMLGRRGGGGRGGGEGGRSLQTSASKLPKGKNGREMALVSALAACGDELRQADKNESLLHDDWRIGRAIRLAWPPAPEPPGYKNLSPNACDVTGVLQDLYGR
jgi:hypothetical protein